MLKRIQPRPNCTLYWIRFGVIYLLISSSSLCNDTFQFITTVRKTLEDEFHSLLRRKDTSNNIWQVFCIQELFSNQGLASQVISPRSFYTKLFAPHKTHVLPLWVQQFLAMSPVFFLFFSSLNLPLLKWWQYFNDSLITFEGVYLNDKMSSSSSKNYYH